VKGRPFLVYAWRRTLHNFPQKLLALIAAVLLWFVATADQRERIERIFPVDLRVYDDTLTTPQSSRRSVTGVPKQVRVTLSGPRNRLLTLSGEEIEASITVTNLGEGAFNEPIRVRGPEGVQVVRFTPSVVSGFIDTEVTRTVSVNLTVSTPPERAIPTYDVTPGSVLVTGAQRSVEAVGSLITVPVTLPRGATAEARVIALDSAGRPVTDVRMTPSSVTVQRTDRGDLPIKTLTVRLPDTPKDLEIVTAEIDPPRVRVIADPTTLANLGSTVVARVPLREGRYSASANLALPAGARSIDVVTVTLDIRRRGANP